MKMIRGTLKLTLILYICAALSGVYILSASARITPHEGDDDTMLITIEKGDTLWDLCQEHLKDPLRWRELSKYNDFTNPHLIYPGEKLRIPLAMAKNVVQIAEDELAELREKLASLGEELDALNAKQKEKAAREQELLDKIKELQSQLKDAKEQADSEKVINKQFDDFVQNTNKQFDDFVQNTNKQFDDFVQKVEAQADETKKQVETVKSELKATDEHITSLQTDVKTLLAQIETNQKAINEVRMILKDAKGVHEEPSTSKRALVFLTTVAAGIGWFAINAIGGRSGE